MECVNIMGIRLSEGVKIRKQKIRIALQLPQEISQGFTEEIERMDVFL